MAFSNGVIKWDKKRGYECYEGLYIYEWREKVKREKKREKWEMWFLFNPASGDSDVISEDGMIG